MTGFTRREWHHDTGSYSWEMRSVNHRFLELSFRLPEALRDLEPELREQARTVLSRGKVDIYLNYQPAESAHPEVIIHQALLKKLIAVQSEVSALLPHVAPVDPLQLMRWPGVLVIGHLDIKHVKDFLLDTFTQTLKSLVQDREREGNSLTDTIFKRLESMRGYVHTLKESQATLIEQQRAKLQTRVQALSVELEPTRLEQEVVLLAQRCDIAEEIDRLHTHIQQMDLVVDQGGAVGRRLDFLLQEMHREANTIGAKSTEMQTTQLSIELKVLIEQMREQVQNIE
jgi:uncharacterized protein (TIGR00255 family)